MASTQNRHVIENILKVNAIVTKSLQNDIMHLMIYGLNTIVSAIYYICTWLTICHGELIPLILNRCTTDEADIRVINFEADYEVLG